MNSSELKQYLWDIRATLDALIEAIPEDEVKPEYIIIVTGDTLSKIANDYETTVDRLVELNGIKDPNVIRAGNKLRIR